MKNVFIYSILIIFSVLFRVDLQAQEAGHTHEHPDETCFICDADKRDTGRLWCRGHARYEDRCWLCHPELEDKDRPYCTEHFLYEDECFLCDPSLKKSDNHADTEDDHASHGPAIDAHAGHGHGQGHTETEHGLFCNEHGVPEVECGICQPQLASTLSAGENLKIRMPSAESAKRAGIETATADRREARPQVESLCEVQYNMNALAKVSPFADGIILKVLCDVGNEVNAGDPLVILHSAAVADAKSAFLSASVNAEISRKSYMREKRLREQDIASEQEFLEAEANHQTARLVEDNLRQKLINLGLSEDEIAEVTTTRDTSANLLVRAPFSGTIVERTAVMGESARTGQALVTIADLSTFWLALSIPTNVAGSIQVGQPVEAHFPELPGRVLFGRISWIDTSVDPRSRMLRARAVIEHPGDAVRHGLYGKAYIGMDSARPMSLLPRDAVQQHEGNHFVFVEDEPDLFSLRRVSIGVSLGDQLEVVAGLQPEDSVVVRGTFVVMSEFLKSRLGAGCAGH